MRTKEVAKEKYEDALASGDAAVLAERSSEKKEALSIKLGNLQPEQVARLKVQLIVQLQIVQGSYHFELPTSFYPDYSRHGVDAGQFKYSFSYRVVLACQTKI